MRRSLIHTTSYEQPTPTGNVYTFDFQNDWDLGWTWVRVWGNPLYVTWEWWEDQGSSVQDPIMPPTSVYDGNELISWKLWVYKGLPAGYSTVGFGCAGRSLNPNVVFTQTWSYPNVLFYNGTEYRTQVSDYNGEITIEFIMPQGEQTLYASLNGDSQVLIWNNFGREVKLARSNQNLGMGIARWGNSDASKGIIRKLQITTA